jgi:hypothetical protein
LELAGIIRKTRALISVKEQSLFSIRIRRRVILRLIEERPLFPYELPTCNNFQYQELEQQILRQARDLAEAESTAENLSTVLAGLSVETREATEKASILAGQLKKASLFLIIVREKEIIIILKNECIIYRLVIPRIRNNTT